MGKLVRPETYFIGATTLLPDGFLTYLKDSGNDDFLDSVAAARAGGLSDGEVLCSFYAKLCYASLTLGKNANVTRIRDIPDNLRNCFEMGHGSVFEHAQLNFVVRNCSRVLTHELVRHRVGTAFSQTSGRYVRGDNVDVVFAPILEPVKARIERLKAVIEVEYGEMVRELGLDDMQDFALKKQLTSALRRMLPNGQANEIGFSLNLRTLRHTVQVRTSRQAEWEIRLVFNQIYDLVKGMYPLMLHGALEETIKGLVEVSGMKLQPYEK